MAWGCTVREAKQKVDSYEFSQWQAFYSIFPFGEYRADIRQAMTSQILANVHRGKNQKPFKLDDFIVGAKKRRKRRKRMTWREIKSVLFGFKR